MRIKTISGYEVVECPEGLEVYVDGVFKGDLPDTTLEEFECDYDDGDAYVTCDLVTDEEICVSGYQLEEAIEKEIGMALLWDKWD